MYKKLRTHVHNRVLVQLVMFAVVSLALLAAVCFDAVAGEIGLPFVGLALAIGIVAGFFVGKIFKLAWHEDTRKVIMSLDRTSFILIGVYILFRIFGDQLLGHYIQGATLSAFSFAFLGGLLVGRLASIWHSVTNILKQQGIV
ncbi:MAG TPA: hypothetical protein VG753_00365 [Candidatus Paceibacterota bacterium]|nr:hypothetical protein [Candidatus Paceibacterota bacterium]